MIFKYLKKNVLIENNWLKFFMKNIILPLCWLFQYDKYTLYMSFSMNTLKYFVFQKWVIAHFWGNFSMYNDAVVWKQLVCLTRVDLSVNSILVYYNYQINLHFLRKYNLYVSRAITHCSAHCRNLEKLVFQPWHIPSLCWKGLGDTNFCASKFYFYWATCDWYI